MTTDVNYQPNIPQRNDTIAISQSNFLNNFGDLYDVFSRNHTALDNPLVPGDHEVVELVELDQNQSISTEFDEIAIYSKKVDGQTDQLFMRYPTNGKEFQLTNYQIYPIDDTPTQKSYFSFLPGGIVVYFGMVTPNADGFKINLNPAICSVIMGVNLCPIGASTSNNLMYPSWVNLVPAANGKIIQIILNNSSILGRVPPPQYYLIFGNQ